MTDTTATHESVNAADMLARQRQAFLDEEVPTLKQRKARLTKLRAAVLAYRTALEQAISDDFGHRSRHETGLLELTVIIQSIDYLSRNLRRFMKPERRHVGLFYRAGSAHVEYQPLGVVGIMAPWNYPVSLTLIPLATALAAGNRAILKPSELTPQTSEAIHRMMAETFSAEEVAVVLGGPEVGAACGVAAGASGPTDRLACAAACEAGAECTMERTLEGMGDASSEWANCIGYALCAVLSLLFVWRWVEETKGKTLEEMHNEAHVARPSPH